MDTKSAIVTGLWAVSVCAGVTAMIRYQVTPGLAATPPKAISARTAPEKGDLLVFLHPQCPCSRATVSELARITTSRPGVFKTKFFFYKPAGEKDSWCTSSGLWKDAKEIGGATLTIDTDGQAAKKYGARCSGQILLYATASGSLAFSGGITVGRGHEGESIGGDALLAFAQGDRLAVTSTPVYGCALYSGFDSDKSPLLGVR